MSQISTSRTITFVPRPETAVQYRIIPSASSVRCDPDNTLTPAILTFSVLRTSGENAVLLTHAQATAEGLVIRSVDFKHNVPSTGWALTSADNVDSYTFTLFRTSDPNTILDRVSIPVLHEFKGENGRTWVPVVSLEGNLSWTLTEADKAPQPVNIKGPAGESPAVWRVSVTPAAIAIDASGNPTSRSIYAKIYRIVGDTETEIDVNDVPSYGMTCRFGYVKNGTMYDKTMTGNRYTLANLNPELDADAYYVRLTGNGDTMPQVAIAVVPVTRPGVTGATIRVTEWSGEGLSYCDGTVTDPGSGLRYLDIVSVTANGARSMWVCCKPHISSEDNKPQSDSAYWMPMDSQMPIYTPLLLADNARIDFLNGQEIAIYSNTKTNGDYPVVGRMGFPSGLVSQDPDLNLKGERSVLWLGETPDSSVYKGTVNIGKLGTVRIGPHRQTHFVIRPDRGSIELRKAASGQTFLSFDGNGVSSDDMGRAGIEDIVALLVDDKVLPCSTANVSQIVPLASFRLTQPTVVKVATSARVVNNGLESAQVLPVILSGLTGLTEIVDTGEFDPEHSATSSAGVVLDVVDGVTPVALPAGQYRFAVKVLLSRKLGISGSYSGTGSATLYSRTFAITACTTDEIVEYKARYTTNGFIISNSRSDYCAIFSEGTGAEASLAFEFRNRYNTGLRLNSSGIEITDDLGIWTPLKEYIRRIAVSEE